MKNLTRQRRSRTRSLVLLVGLTVAVALVGAACTKGSQPKSGAQSQGQQLTETAFAQQQAGTPYPADQLSHSLERDNLKNRLLRLNDASKIGYVYLLSFTGTPFGFYSIKGKVSSTDSQMTTTDLIQGCPDHRSENPCAAVVPAPGDDGSYGVNEPGIFFFTTEGTLVETSVNYIYSDAPLPIDVPQLNAK